MKKDDYGKVPQYIKKIKHEIKVEADYLEKVQREADEAERSHIRQLSEEDRQKLIKQLEMKWDSVNSDYQMMTHLTVLDTLGRRRKKENFEKELKQIENDLNKFNANSKIFINSNI